MIYDIMISYIDILQHSSGISQPRRIRSSCPSHGMQDQTQHHLLQRSHHIKSLDATLENEVTGHHFFGWKHYGTTCTSTFYKGLL